MDRDTLKAQLLEKGFDETVASSLAEQATADIPLAYVRDSAKAELLATLLIWGDTKEGANYWRDLWGQAYKEEESRRKNAVQHT